jgi:hypothetical protein
VRRVGRELDVHYVVEGSVRRFDSHTRLSVHRLAVRCWSADGTLLPCLRSRQGAAMRSRPDVATSEQTESHRPGNGPGVSARSELSPSSRQLSKMQAT